MAYVKWLKPAVFIACLLPALHLFVGAYNTTTATPLLGIDLGADPVKDMLHTAGLWALRFVVITLCMTPLRKLTGSPAWLRLRRMFGLYAFFYAVLHFSVYLFLDQAGNLRGLWDDVIKRPYITIGFTALLLLIPLAVTSTAKAQRRMKLRWTQLHRSIYLIAGLGVWHYWWLVKKDIRPPLMYACAVALLLGYRIWQRRRMTSRVIAAPPAASHAS
jgi:sulfoxide reductase heme-binding subunit YedZ